MKKIWQNLSALGVMTLIMSGCSIVVFEDGPDCPAPLNCPGAEIPMTSYFDEEAELSAPSNQTQITQPPTTQPDVDQPNSQLVLPPPLVEGHVTYFAYDTATVGAEAKSELLAIASFLADNPDIGIIIEGHCDERGSRDYNLALGDRRATAVGEILRSNGVSAARIRTVSYGKERPVAVGSTPEIWARNRRAMIRTLTR